MMRALVFALATIFLLTSLAAVGIASHVIGDHLPLLVGTTISGYSADRLAFVTLGLSTALLKMGLVFEGVRRRGQSRAIGWLNTGMTLICLAYTWSVLMWALAMITPLANQPVPTIALSMGAVAVLESAATLLPAIAWARPIVGPTEPMTKPAPDNDDAMRADLADSTPVLQPSSLIGLLRSAATPTVPAFRLAGIQCAHDGRIADHKITRLEELLPWHYAQA